MTNHPPKNLITTVIRTKQITMGEQDILGTQAQGHRVGNRNKAKGREQVFAQGKIPVANHHIDPNTCCNQLLQVRKHFGVGAFPGLIGMEVVDEIAKVPTGNKGMHQDVPKDTVTIEKGERIATA